MAASGSQIHSQSGSNIEKKWAIRKMSGVRDRPETSLKNCGAVCTTTPQVKRMTTRPT